MNKLFIRLLKSRNLTPDFLHPHYEKLADPFTMPDMKKAINRIKQAVDGNERILIYGDYDVDGVTASTVMEQALIMAGAKSDNLLIMLPDRFADGYGMSPKLVKRAVEQNINLVITVDCGSRNHDIVAQLNSSNIDCVITDHHETDDELPKAIAIVNPKRKDYQAQNGLRDLAGVGVAFKIAQALTKEGMIKDGQEKWLLDLVVIGTMCDSMPITNENRILGFYGLKVLEQTRRLGLKELMKNAGVNKLNSDSVGYQIGPRLNAAGRLKTADLALNLLRASSPAEAANLAAKLEELNKQRKTEQLSAVKEIDQRGVSNEPVIVEAGKWHEGIIGIVAGRLVEKYHRPAFVFTELENGTFKGSSRSFGDFNLAEALSNLEDAIISGGGHAGAAGVKIESEKLYAFRERMEAYYESLNLKDQEKYLKTSADLEIEDLSDIDIELTENLKLLEPFGPGNEDPIFCIKNATIENKTLMGEDQNHLRLDIVDKKGNKLKLIAFYAPEKWLNLNPEIEYEIMFRPTENEFRSVRSVEGRIVDIYI